MSRIRIIAGEANDLPPIGVDVGAGKPSLVLSQRPPSPCIDEVDESACIRAPPREPSLTGVSRGEENDDGEEERSIVLIASRLA